MIKISRLHTGLLALGLLALAAAGCAGSDGASGEQAAGQATPSRSVRVETLVLEPTSFTDIVELTGTIEALDDATLSAQASGTVVSLVDLGRTVSAGAAVAQLDPGIPQTGVRQAEATVEAARAQFALAEDNLKRQEPLYRDSVISAIEFENVRAQYNQAQAQLSQAEAALAQAGEQLNNTRVTTPFAGTVEQHFVNEGEQVTPGVQIARVVNTRRVKATAGVPERYASDIEVGTPVEIAFQTYGAGQRTGTVSFVGRAIDPQSRTFPIEVVLDNRDGQLKPQMVAKFYITRDELEDVLVVPRDAILRDEEGTSVFVVNRTDSAAVADSREITLGSAYAGHVVVASGLTAGEEVIVLGQTNVTQGDAVQVVEQHERLAPAAAPFQEDGAAGAAPPATP